MDRVFAWGICVWTAGLFGGGLMPAWAGALVIDVVGIERSEGEIGCALHDDPNTFPMESDDADELWQKAEADGVECRFEALGSGRYAVAISQDFNGNRMTDTNFVGMPTEPWGVSNNVRPFLRAPRFDEAAVEIEAGATLRIEVELAQ